MRQGAALVAALVLAGCGSATSPVMPDAGSAGEAPADATVVPPDASSADDATAPDAQPDGGASAAADAETPDADSGTPDPVDATVPDSGSPADAGPPPWLQPDAAVATTDACSPPVPVPQVLGGSS